MNTGLPDIIVSVVNHSNPALLADCLRSLYATTKSVSFEVWVIDNATDGRGVNEMKAEFLNVRWLHNEQRQGFSANHNQVLSRAQGRYYCVLNDDTMIYDGALDELAAFMDTHTSVGVAGPRVLNPDGTLQLSTFRFPKVSTELVEVCYLPRRFHALKELGFDSAHKADEPANVDWLLGACLLIRREALRDVGLFDSELSPVANTEELDWCHRAGAKGWQVTFCPAARIMHYGGQSLWATKRRGIDWTRVELMRTRLAYFAKHRGRRAAFGVSLVYSVALPWNALVLLQSWVRGRTARSRAWDEVSTLAAGAWTSLGEACSSCLRRRTAR